jgi:hypothetical protein
MHDLHLRLTVDVRCLTDGVSWARLAEKLNHLIAKAAADGAITGDTDAELVHLTQHVEAVVPISPPAPGQLPPQQHIVIDVARGMADVQTEMLPPGVILTIRDFDVLDGAEDGPAETTYQGRTVYDETDAKGE